MAIVSNVVTNMSNIAVCDAFEKIIREHIPNHRWLGNKNIFRKDTVNKTDKLSLNKIKPKQLSQYIASSTILHCYDGWNFISRGIDSILNNDISSAIHFLYYAELRAVMSFMAYNGVGIFNNKHFWFDNTSTCLCIEQMNNNHNPTLSIGTHRLATLCLNELSKVKNQKDCFFDLIRVNNKKLSEWINATNWNTRSGYVTEVMGKWLKDWSIDLNLKQDQDLRNETSYRPHFKFNYLNIQESIKKLEKIWKAIEPTESSRFHTLDRNLARLALERVFSQSTGKSAHSPKNKLAFHSFINNTFDRIGEPKNQLYQFFLREINPEDHFIITEGKKNLNNKKELNLSDPFPMLCRSILLLRLSSGCVYELIDNSTLEKKNLRYWWENICNNIGISKSLDTDISPSDLYTDIADSFSTILENTNAENLQSIFLASKHFGGEFDTIKQFQRACFWGIGL